MRKDADSRLGPEGSLSAIQPRCGGVYRSRKVRHVTA
jgi:hypothetical protein